MQPDIPLLQQTILFSGIEAEALQHLLTCLGGSVRRYGRGEFLWHAGDTVLQAGIVLQGAVDAVQYREDGAMQLVARHTAGGVLGEMLMAAGEASPVSGRAPEGAEVFHEVQPMLDAAGEDAFVIGGAQVYRLLLPACRRLYVTQIDADGGADVFFPEPAPELWCITEQSPWQEEQGLRYRYVTYERKEERDEV